MYKNRFYGQARWVIFCVAILLGIQIVFASGTAVSDTAQPQNNAASAEDPFQAVRENIQVCATCHGERGASPQSPEYPILAGQHLFYLYTQLKDYKEERRANPIMQPMAAELSNDQMLLLAEYFSKQTWASPEAPEITDKQTIQAKRMISAGQCVQCHRGGFDGDSRIPRLAGQNSQYLDKTMRDFKNLVRRNSPAKNSLLKTFNDEDIKAFALYAGNLKLDIKK